MKKINDFFNTKYNYKVIIIIFIFLFSLGITSGVYLNKLYSQGNSSIADYIARTNNYYSNSNFNISQLLFLNVKNDFIYLLSMYLCSLVVVTFPLVLTIIFFKGLSIGYTVNTLVLTLKVGSIKSILLILMKNILIIPFSILVIIISLNYFMESISALRYSSKFRNMNYMKKVAKKYSVNIAGLFMLIIVLQGIINAISMLILKRIF